MDKFKYFGSARKEEGGCESEIWDRVKAAWVRLKVVSGVVCYRRMPRKLKVKYLQ